MHKIILFFICFSSVWIVWVGLSALRAQSSWVWIGLGTQTPCWIHQAKFISSTVCRKESLSGTALLSGLLLHLTCGRGRLLDRREQGHYQESPGTVSHPTTRGKQESVIPIDEWHNICARFKQLFTGHLSMDISGTPNSPFTMGSSCLTNAPALPAQPTMPGSEQEPRLWASTGLFQPPWPQWLGSTTNTVLASHTLQTNKGSLLQNAHMWVRTLSPYSIMILFLAYKNVVSPPEDYQMLYKTSCPS